MIARHWRGWTTAANASVYEEHLRSTTFPQLATIDGHEGVYVLRRPDGELVEFGVVTLWRSLDAVRAFAGADYETAVVPRPARRVLERFDETVLHYEVLHAPEGGWR